MSTIHETLRLLRNKGSQYYEYLANLLADAAAWKNKEGDWDTGYSHSQGDGSDHGDVATNTSDISTLQTSSAGWDSTESTVDAGAPGWDSTKSTVDTGDSNWDAAYTHSTDSDQAHSDYMKNNGDTATGNYNFDSGTLYIDAVANEVGIGTTSPGEQLHSYGTDPTIKIENTTTGAASLKLKNTASEWQIYTQSNTLYINDVGQGKSRFSQDADGNTTLFKDDGELRGIQLRDIGSSSDMFEILHAGGTDGTIIGQLGASSPMRFYTNGSERARFEADGIYSMYNYQPHVGVYRATVQTLPTSVWTRIAFDTVVRDVQTEWNNSTKVYTCKDAGVYQINTSVRIDPMIGTQIYYIGININGVRRATTLHTAAQNTNAGCLRLCHAEYMSAGQYVEVVAYRSEPTVPTNIFGDANIYTYLTIAKIA